MDKPNKKKSGKSAERVWLCLEFSNTAGINMSEQLPDYQALLDWALNMGILNDLQAETQRQWSLAHPAKAGAIHKRAHKLRNAVFGLFAALNAKEPVAQKDMEALNSELAAALGSMQVQRTPDGFIYTWPQCGQAPDYILWQVARSASELLVSKDHARVKVCASERCNWLFFDTSKNRSRRWCDMKVCGNREKARRHYKKQSEAGKGQSG
jgi:predicted RNA-binding Zn ribbon-like protein